MPYATPAALRAALEARLASGEATTVRGLELAVRQAGEDAGTIRDHLIEALAEDPERDGFEFRVGPAKALDLDEAGRAGWRFTIDARLDGRTFANVRLDVVARTEEISRTDR